MELNLHRVTECTLKPEHFEGEPAVPGSLPTPAFHVTHLSIVYEDGSKAKIRLFSPEKLEIRNE